MFVHLPCLKSNDDVSAFAQPLRSRRVVGGLIRLGVRVAINVDGQARLGAIEVEDETTDRLLAADLEAELTIPDR